MMTKTVYVAYQQFLVHLWHGVCTEWIKVICRQPDASISCITSEVCIKAFDCLPCLAIGRVHHDSVILMYTFFVPPIVSSGSS
jgi:hypothetical protein